MALKKRYILTILIMKIMMYVVIKVTHLRNEVTDPICSLAEIAVNCTNVYFLVEVNLQQVI